jgi:release factor glutamine methyltransferase
MTQTVAMVLRDGTRLLAAVIGDSAARDARILMAHMLGIGTDRLVIELSRTITSLQVAQYENLIKRRATFEPLSHITGKRLFWKNVFRVTADVLDPRPDTETLIELALCGPAPNRILDLGTGSGCILLSLLGEWTKASGLGTDTSAPAIEIAIQNANDLGFADRANFCIADWFLGIAGRFDLIVSNPPYISATEMNSLAPDVRNFEPHAALTPGGDGLAAYRQIAAGLSNFLAPQGRAFLEIGFAQGAAVKSIFSQAGYKNVSLHQDINRRDRVIAVNYSKNDGN